MVWLNCVLETVGDGRGMTDGEIPAGMPDMNAMMATATRNAGYTGMAPPSEVKDDLYVCVVDIRVTDRSSTSGGHSASHAVKKELRYRRRRRSCARSSSPASPNSSNVFSDPTSSASVPHATV